MTPEQLKWHREQCVQYRVDFESYKIFAGALEQMLKAACRLHAPLAIVQSRPKAFSSFSEKMARKAARYMALGIGPTDLCGARVVTETQAEVDRICEVIRKSFVIDKENSIDVRTRLKAAEFGYLSVHYVVELRGDQIFGVPVPPEIGARKAEIQVRTLLQHAWASISHDRIYKSSFQVPQHLSRELARVAAFLEEADQQFGASVQSLDAYKLHYGAYMDKKRLEEEVAILETVLESEPEPGRKPEAALRLAQVARATGYWERVQELLAAYLDVKGDYQTEVLAEHGHALCQLHQDHPRGPQFRNGQAEMEQAAGPAQGDLRSRVLAYRAWASARVPDNEHQARDRYREALEADPQNPFYLASYVEYEIYCGEPLGFRALMRPVFVKAIRKCRAHADAGIELPWAFFTMGRFYLLLDQPYESLAAYTKGIRQCLSGESSVPVTLLDAELAFVRRIHRARQLPATHTWIRDLLLLAKSLQARQFEPSLAQRRNKFQHPVVIFAGDTAAGSEERIQQVRNTLMLAFEGFSGTIISGGTPAGLAGIAGAIAETLKASAGGPVEVLGYVPKSLPFDQPTDPRYTALIATDDHDFSAREPLQYWIDLLAAGVAPADVRVVGIGGGQISAFEYRLALALGASLAIIEPASGAAPTLCKELDWGADTNLLCMPNDPMTIRAFVNPPRPALTEDEIEKAARRIHERFLEENRHKNPDPAMKPYDDLIADLKASNRMQAERAAGFLERVGYRVQRTSGAITEPILTADEVELMAEMEHGRWVLERLQSGWRFDATRDPAKKLSPSLVPWRELSSKVKQWDRDAVLGWPRILAEVGLEVVR